MEVVLPALLELEHLAQGPTAPQGAVTAKATKLSTISLSWKIGRAAGFHINTPWA